MSEIGIDESKAHLETAGDWIHWVEQRFQESGLCFGHGTDNAWDEAVHLVLHVLHLPLNSDKSVLSESVTSAAANAISKLAEARIETRKPLPYLIHEAWFAGLPFYVDERVIVPRSPFAEWLENHFNPWLDADSVTQVLDIGTGSGCMAIVAALAFPEAHIDAVDIDPNALEVAVINVNNYDLKNRITLYRSDCFVSLPAKQYDLIMSNPPYVSAQEMQTLPAEYLCEPPAALEANDEGLAIVLQILRGARAFLSENGILVIELGNTATTLQSRYPQVPFVWLEQERGGHGLLLITAKELAQLQF